MCGIAGTINIKFDKHDLSVLNHRGPDSSGIVSFKQHHHECYLGQTRLSIVDLSSAGFQPMTDVSGRYTIVLNGEIYNHTDLRKEILNVTFKGHSDTETVLYYLIQKGIKSVDKLNRLDYMVVLDARMALSDDLLLYTDKISMKNSLEVRVPFLDLELMKFVESLLQNLN